MKRALKYLKIPPSIVNLEGEIWVPTKIDGLNYQYEVSNFGRVKYFSRHLPCLLKLPANNKIPYQAIVLYGYTFIPDRAISVHRLVALHFVPNPLNLPEVNHLDFNKSNNKASNLEWVTRKQNSQHALLGGVRNFKYGADNHSSKTVLNTETGVFYVSLKDACTTYNLSYGTMIHRMKGRLKNLTPFIYV